MYSCKKNVVSIVELIGKKKSAGGKKTITVRLVSCLYLQPQSNINGQIKIFVGKWHFLGIWKGLNLGLKALRQLLNENHTENWALGYHPRNNAHLTRLECLYNNIILNLIR